LEKLKLAATSALARVKPDFVAIAYAVLHSGNKTDAQLYLGITESNIEVINNAAKSFDGYQQFVEKFNQYVGRALVYANDKEMANKKAALIALHSSKDYLFSYDRRRQLHQLIRNVKNTINKLDIKKDSLSYTFETSIKLTSQEYIKGVRYNKRYDRQNEKRRVGERKDIDQLIQNYQIINDRLIKYYEEETSQLSYDVDVATREITDFFTAKASESAHVMNSHIAKKRAIKLMEEVGIPEAEKRFSQYPFQFSGGMRQRVVIAIALSSNPEILICDEPTTALDVTIQAQILELINDLKKKHNLSVIFITHDLGVVANMADRIAVMYAGKIVETGTSEELFYDPKHPYTWALLSSMPDLETTEQIEAIPGTPPNMLFPPKGDAFAERNKYAMEIDFEEQPPLFKVTDTHYAATWLLHPNAPKVEIPKIVTERIERNKKYLEALNGQK
jgi:oligopeptide/dipeptide ABC transporter ATP-binding protein